MKISSLSAFVSLALLAELQPGAAQAQETPPVRDIGAEVRGIFAAKCAGCHGHDLAKPRGRFGYVLDLRKVAANPEMVIPQRPEESELWVLVQRGEMPPTDSPHGTLTQEQKEVVRTWIAAGAPDASDSQFDSTASVGSEPLTAISEIATVDRLLRWLGKFHLLLLHFPIALILVAGIGEAWSIWQRNVLPSELVRYCLCLAAMAAVPTAGLGWLHAAAGNGVGSPQLLILHRGLGTTAAAWIAITALCSERDARLGQRSRRVRLLLISGIIITAGTAHMGGLLAHGEDFFAY